MLYSFAALLSTSWILTILSATNAELKKLEIRDVDLLAGNSFADNPSALLVDDSFDEDFMTGSKSDVFLAGTGDVDSTSLFAHTSDLDYSLTDSNLASSLAESASDLFVANNIDCEAGNVDSLELVGKRRRGTICPDPSAPPVGQLDPPENEEGKKIAPQSPSALATSDEAVKAGFGENFDVCPKNFYLKSNTPVCKTYPELFREAGQSWLHLYDVEPILSFSAPQLCREDEYLYCCQIVLHRLGAMRDPFRIFSNALFDRFTVGLRYWDAYVCFPVRGRQPVDSVGPVTPNF